MGGVASPPLALPCPGKAAAGALRLGVAFSSMETGCGPLLASHLQEGPFSCPICLDALRDPATTPCGHNFCLSCLEAHRHHPAAAGVAGGQGTSRCPLCQEPFPADLQLRKNHTLAELLQFRQPASAAPRSPGSARMSPEEEAAAAEPGAAEDNSKSGRPAGEAEAPAPRPEVLCDFCTGDERAEAAQSCLVCLASFCAPHLQPHLKSPAFQGHRLVPPLRRIEESLCKLHLKPLESFCRTDRSCICQLCRAQGHRSHEVVAVEVEREHVEVSGGGGGAAAEIQRGPLCAPFARGRRALGEPLKGAPVPAGGGGEACSVERRGREKQAGDENSPGKLRVRNGSDVDAGIPGRGGGGGPRLLQGSLPR